MSIFVPPNHWLLSDRDRANDTELRGRLATGDEEAFYIDASGGLFSIFSNEWISDRGEAMLECGYYAPRFYKYLNGWHPLDHDRSYSTQVIIVRHKKIKQPPQGPISEAEYLSPFLIMMIDASRHFNIRPGKGNPKKPEIEEFFRRKILPDGTPISASQASSMATFVRPPEAMRGGQKKVGWNRSTHLHQTLRTFQSFFCLAPSASFATTRRGKTCPLQ